MLGTMSVTPTGTHPDPQDHRARGHRAQDPRSHDPYARERAYPAPPLRGPSAGRWRVPVVWTVALAFLAIPLLVVVLRFMNGLGGWIMVIYVMFGILLQVLGGLAVSLSLLMLPRVNTVHERRSGIRLGTPLTVLLAVCWATGVLGPGTFPDAGDAPDSGATLPWATRLWGYDLAAEITTFTGFALTAVSALCGAAAILVCLVRRLRSSSRMGVDVPDEEPRR